MAPVTDVLTIGSALTGSIAGVALYKGVLTEEHVADTSSTPLPAHLTDEVAQKK
ncbi:hypothetical protein [Lysinibacter sp. HNR]|uniref:hypothetical protein n=1 Tax=Lysinibacter sp. HNR TaxID=3031408 RepID=UPI002435E163|nr:hypothetical protein [Lysinibacter sp. HNR]WGD37276.1 hypothetical protein FrondiHNR_12740 [Lysinibacter sp. HNR]